jgi:hypothetical protein
MKQDYRGFDKFTPEHKERLLEARKEANGKLSNWLKLVDVNHYLDGGSCEVVFVDMSTWELHVYTFNDELRWGKPNNINPKAGKVYESTVNFESDVEPTTENIENLVDFLESQRGYIDSAIKKFKLALSIREDNNGDQKHTGTNTLGTGDL